MYQIHLPIKKYQTVAGTAAVIGFLLGVLIPTTAFITGRWSCPLGNGVVGIGGFAMIAGVVGAAVVGNVVALLIIFIAKRRQSSSKSNSSRRRGN